MLHLMEALPPEFWAAYARARYERACTGRWPGLGRLRELALEEEADGWALVVLTLGVLPELAEVLPPGALRRKRQLTGELAGVRADNCPVYGRALVLAPHPDALLALQLLGHHLYCDVVDPWGRRVPPRELHRAAADWAEALAGHVRGERRLRSPSIGFEHLLPPSERN